MYKLLDFFYQQQILKELIMLGDAMINKNSIKVTNIFIQAQLTFKSIIRRADDSPGHAMMPGRCLTDWIEIKLLYTFYHLHFKV